LARSFAAEGLLLFSLFFIFKGAQEGFAVLLDQKTKNQVRKSFSPQAFTFGPLFCQATARSLTVLKSCKSHKSP
jgi:hypothetical protein